VNRSVPTLLGIMILLMVAVLVVLIYDYRLTSGLAAGQTVVGTVGGEMLTRVQQPTEQISPSEVFARQAEEPKRINPMEMQRKHGKATHRMVAQERAQQRRAARAGAPGRVPAGSPRAAGP